MEREQDCGHCFQEHHWVGAGQLSLNSRTMMVTLKL